MEAAVVVKSLHVVRGTTRALRGVSAEIPRGRGGDSVLIARDAAIVLGVTVLVLALGAATLRRRTP